jgi:hypothetical protein
MIVMARDEPTDRTFPEKKSPPRRRAWFHRTSNDTPPSRKGGEVKDATLIDGCLEVSRRLQAGGFGRKRVFSASSTKDDCEGGRLHRVLAVDLGAVGLGFATNLPWAVHEIKTA